MKFKSSTFRAILRNMNTLAFIITSDEKKQFKEQYSFPATINNKTK